MIAAAASGALPHAHSCPPPPKSRYPTAVTHPPPIPTLPTLLDWLLLWLDETHPLLGDIVHAAAKVALFDRAASLTFFAILAAVPSLLAGFSVLGFALAAVDGAGHATGADIHVRGEALQQVTAWLRQSLPGVTWNPADFATAMIKHRHTHGVIGFAAAIWLGLGVFSRIDDAIRDVFGRKRRHTLRAVGFMAVLVAVAAVLAMLVVLFGPLAVWGIHVANSTVKTLSFGWLSVMDAAAAFSQALPVAVVFYAMVRWSARLRKRRLAALIGVAFGLLWSVGQRLFTLYVTSVVKMDAVYGALTGVLALMLWLYYANVLFLLCVAWLAAVDRRARQP